ncbi:olfactory receptor 14A16-like [Guaruba guarouba]
MVILGLRCDPSHAPTLDQRFHGLRQQMSNGSSITQFLLLLFADARELQLCQFWLFLSISLAVLMDNGLRITSTACDQHLHTPMYFFLLNLSLLDLGCISTTVPKSMANSLWMAAAAWGTGFLYALLHTANTFSLPLCQGNVVEQFFCEIPQTFKLSCSHSYLREIFRAVLRILSEQRCHKDFSTCLLHLAVVSVFVTTGTYAYLKPRSISSSSLDLVVSVLYSVVPSAVNPLIYSLRNQELKDAEAGGSPQPWRMGLRATHPPCVKLTYNKNS